MRRTSNPVHIEASRHGRVIRGQREGGNLERIFEQKSGDLQRILTGGGLSRRSICRTLVKSCYQHPWFSILS
jgi:hypothetical protein